uniref:FABP domain-containing protein n=1 Tax=Heterorhabditis bacteriophora TaxID=37862 RepID=A0A1I7XQ49_HETBA
MTNQRVFVFQGSVTLFHDRVKHYSEEFLSCYVSLVTNKLFNTFVILLWLTFLAVCALVGHYSDAYQSHPKKVIFQGFFITRGAWGPESTNYFLRDFVEYEKTMRELEAEGEEVKEGPVIPEFNVTVFSDDGIYLDLIDNMPTDTWQVKYISYISIASPTSTYRLGFPKYCLTIPSKRVLSKLYASKCNMFSVVNI